MARWHTIDPFRYTILPARSTSFLHSELEKTYCSTKMTQDCSESRKSISKLNITNLKSKIANHQQLLLEKCQYLEIHYSRPGKTASFNMKPVRTLIPRNPSKLNYRNLNYTDLNFKYIPAINNPLSLSNCHQRNETGTIQYICTVATNLCVGFSIPENP